MASNKIFLQKGNDILTGLFCIVNNETQKNKKEKR